MRRKIVEKEEEKPDLKLRRHSVVRASHKRTVPSDDPVTIWELSFVYNAALTIEVWPLTLSSKEEKDDQT